MVWCCVVTTTKRGMSERLGPVLGHRPRASEVTEAMATSTQSDEKASTDRSTTTGIHEQPCTCEDLSTGVCAVCFIAGWCGFQEGS